MTDNLATQLARVPELLGAHMLLTAAALGIGVGVSLPLALWIARLGRIRWAVLTVAQVLQTIPGLALLALMVPLLGAFGFLPALAALSLYSALPVLRNTITGITGVDPDLTRAARGLGMSPTQVLLQVELPLALPVVIAGIRTSAVWVVGTATLSTPVGQSSLGNFIFGGLQTRNFTAVLVGCVAAAALAVGIDGLLSMAERSLARRERRSLWLALGGLVLMGSVAAAQSVSGGATRDADLQATSSHTPDQQQHATGPIRIGSKTFTEQYVLAALVAKQLQQAGLRVELTESLGSTVAFDALRRGDIDVYVDYSGTLWANGMKRTDVAPAWQVLAELSGWLASEHSIRCLGSLGFENAYALAMRRDRAQELGVRSIADLAKYAPRLSVGSDYEFFERPEWTQLKRAYALSFERRVTFDSTFMYDAVQRREVDVITAFSSDGRIALYDLLVLDDPRRAFPPYDAVLLVSARLAEHQEALGALTPLIGAIDVTRMRKANLMVDRDEDKRLPKEAAEWLLMGK